MTSTPGPKKIETVGVILVHGIGEQRRFEHLDSETRKIVDAIIGNYGQIRRDVTVTLTPAMGDAFQGTQSSWVSGPDAPLHVLVDRPDTIVDIGFHEVWWADVNETLTLGKQIRFWLWSLSLPGLVTYHNASFLPGADATRAPMRAGELTWWHRIRMAYISILFGFSAFSIALVNLILKRLSFSPLLSTGVIVNYLSGVKLYSQDKRAGGSTMDGPDEPPRAAIRRRMIRTMVDVATAKYDRWYILAHSLGSVVAWNGLMEIERALPNYLDRERWHANRYAPLRGRTIDPFPINAMMPNRPIWLGAHEIIKRDALFANFRGLLTYGSPLERFGVLWSSMVPINTDEEPFPDSVEWVNVYDPTDPVGTWIANFDPEARGFKTLKPTNFPCRASPIVLFSHICYFNKSRSIIHSEHSLVNQVAHWLVEGESLATRINHAETGAGHFWMPRTANGTRPGWSVHARAVLRYIQSALVGGVLTLLTLYSWHHMILPIVQGVFQWLGLPVS
jgi:hypothetical protein